MLQPLSLPPTHPKESIFNQPFGRAFLAGWTLILITLLARMSTSTGVSMLSDAAEDVCGSSLCGILLLVRLAA